MLEQLLNMTNASFNNEEPGGGAGTELSGSSCSLVLFPVLHHLVQPGKVSLEPVPAVLGTVVVLEHCVLV